MKKAPGHGLRATAGPRAFGRPEAEPRRVVPSGRGAAGVGALALPEPGARRPEPSRRRFLRGLFRGSLVTVGLPLFDYLLNGNGTALACGGAIPKRFGIYYWGNGNRPDRWTPATDGADFELTDELAPLVNVRSKITVVSGLAVKVDNLVPHLSGAAGLLSGYALITDEDGNDTFAAPSIDQVLAAEIGTDTLYPSIQTAATDASGMSYLGPNAQNPPETDPYALYERLFGDTFREPGEEGVVDPTLGLRRSVLDSVMEDIAALQAKLGAADKARLDQHLTGVRELEERLARLEEDPPALDSCARPAEPLASYPDEDGRPQISARSRVMVDMLAMALACDQTRVFGHYLTDPVSNVLFPGASAGHHNLTHDEGGDQPEVHAITVQIVEELAYLLEKFDSIPEADGTLLDNCVVLGTTEVSLGQTHDIGEIPVVLGGSACGALQTGIHYRSYTADSASKLMLTLVRAMDVLAPSFGDGDAYTEDALTEIET